MYEIELITGTIIKGNLVHHHHKHPEDSLEHKERKNWHYYEDKDTGKIHHLRKEHIIRVTEKK